MPGDAAFAVSIVLGVTAGSYLLRRAFARARVLPEELALAAACVFLGGSLVWLRAALGGSTLLGLGAPWTWLTACHFAAAGAGAVTAFTCRSVSDACALRILRGLLLAHPVAYLVTAAESQRPHAHAWHMPAASIEAVARHVIGMLALQPEEPLQSAHAGGRPV